MKKIFEKIKKAKEKITLLPRYMKLKKDYSELHNAYCRLAAKHYECKLYGNCLERVKSVLRVNLIMRKEAIETIKDVLEMIPEKDITSEKLAELLLEGLLEE